MNGPFTGGIFRSKNRLPVVQSSLELFLCSYIFLCSITLLILGQVAVQTKFSIPQSS